jgi:lysyl-tRNA synthetase class I
MNYQDFIEIVKKQVEVERSILETKGKDYTMENEDRLYNFKLVAELVGITPKQVLMVYWLKHVLSILSHSKGLQETEPIEQRIADVRNYMLLYRGLDTEEEFKDDEIAMHIDDLEKQDAMEGVSDEN